MISTIRVAGKSAKPSIRSVAPAAAYCAMRAANGVGGADQRRLEERIAPLDRPRGAKAPKLVLHLGVGEPENDVQLYGAAVFPRGPPLPLEQRPEPRPALAERRMVRRRLETGRDGRAEAGATGQAGERAQHRPAVVRPSPEPVPVRDAGVPEIVRHLPVASERDDIGSPGLDTDGDHAGEHRRRSGGSQY